MECFIVYDTFLFCPPGFDKDPTPLSSTFQKDYFDKNSGILFPIYFFLPFVNGPPS